MTNEPIPAEREYPPLPAIQHPDHDKGISWTTGELLAIHTYARAYYDLGWAELERKHMGCADCGTGVYGGALPAVSWNAGNTAPGDFSEEIAALAASPTAQAAPIDMVLYCPACGMQHVDAVEELPMAMPGSASEGSAGWVNPPHRSHLCRPEDGGCGHIWRPADVPTNGVQAVQTMGKADSPVVAQAAPAAVAGSAGIYVASRASLPERPARWRALRTAGWPIVSTWIDEAGPGETDDVGELWGRIAREVASAQGVVLHVESDDFPLKGALIEVGMALALGKRVGVYAPGVALEGRSMRPLGSWAAHPLVRITPTLQGARDWIEAAPRPPAVAPAQAAPAPLTLMTEDQASKWAWDRVRQDVGTEGWSTGDSCNFFGFFLHGWSYRGQYELQRRPALTRATRAAAPQPPAEAQEPVKQVYIVATGEEHEGEATYTRYDDAPPPLCDAECLFTHPVPQQTVPDMDGEAFRTAARLGLTLRFHGGCAQSGMPGAPAAYEVVASSDPADAMRQAVQQAATVIASGGEPQQLRASAELAVPTSEQAGALAISGLTDEIDAWKCERCHGNGWHWQSESVNHGPGIGVENVDLKTHCDACGGIGWCGPEADKDRAVPASGGAAPVAEGDADPLQGAVVWLLEALEGCNISDVQSRLKIGFNRASRLVDAARSQAKEGGE